MVSVLYSSFVEGNRCEPFAEYVLSSVSAVIRVPREKDIGFDLLCTLMHRKDRILYAGKSFGVQVKATNEKNKITYGGFKTKGKNKGIEGKLYEIDWLKNLNQPLFICLVNLNEFSLELFRTDILWQLFVESPNPGEIKFNFTNEPKYFGNSEDNFPKQSLKTLLDGTKLGDGYSYQIRLGKPFCKIVLTESLEDNKYRDELRKKIDNELDLSYDNLHFRNLNLPYSRQRVYVNDLTQYPREYLLHEGWNEYYVNQKPTKEGVDLVLSSMFPSIDYLTGASWRNQREEDIVYKFLEIVIKGFKSVLNKGEPTLGKEYYQMRILEKKRLLYLLKSRVRRKKRQNFYIKTWLLSKSK